MPPIEIERDGGRVGKRSVLGARDLAARLIGCLKLLHDRRVPMKEMIERRHDEHDVFSWRDQHLFSTDIFVQGK